jgi:ribosome-binding factor A
VLSDGRGAAGLIGPLVAVMSQRTHRLDRQIQHELMDLLQREMKDPRVGFATVTRVSTARDLGHVTAWISVYGNPEEQGRSMSALDDATPWLRRRLGERLNLRHVPVLTLRQDESIEAGDRVLRLLREIEDHQRSDGQGS